MRYVQVLRQRDGYLVVIFDHPNERDFTVSTIITNPALIAPYCAAQGVQRAIVDFADPAVAPALKREFIAERIAITEWPTLTQPMYYADSLISDS